MQHLSLDAGSQSPKLIIRTRTSSSVYWQITVGEKRQWVDVWLYSQEIIRKTVEFTLFTFFLLPLKNCPTNNYLYKKVSSKRQQHTVHLIGIQYRRLLTCSNACWDIKARLRLLGSSKLRLSINCCINYGTSRLGCITRLPRESTVFNLITVDGTGI